MLKSKIYFAFILITHFVIIGIYLLGIILGTEFSFLGNYFYATIVLGAGLLFIVDFFIIIFSLVFLRPFNKYTRWVFWISAMYFVGVLIYSLFFTQLKLALHYGF